MYLHRLPEAAPATVNTHEVGNPPRCAGCCTSSSFAVGPSDVPFLAGSTPTPPLLAVAPRTSDPGGPSRHISPGPALQAEQEGWAAAGSPCRPAVALRSLGFRARGPQLAPAAQGFSWGTHGCGSGLSVPAQGRCFPGYAGSEASPHPGEGGGESTPSKRGVASCSPRGSLDAANPSPRDAARTEFQVPALPGSMRPRTRACT